MNGNDSGGEAAAGLRTGTRLGRYEIRTPLAAGGMGEVYIAHDPKLGRDVAIKVLPPAFAADPDRLARFEQEARAAGALNHPNIVAVHDVATDDSVPYVVSELLEGESLRQRLAAGPIPQRRAIDYGIQIARGLAAAHARGIVHRDLKPENIVVTADGRAKILDFGLAKLAGPAVPDAAEITRAETNPGLVLGTVGYMAPEQVRGARVDHRADVFSFGCVLYEMMTGRRAFRKGSSVETLNAILSEDPPGLGSAAPPPPPAVERLVFRCLEKEPVARFQSASDLAFALEAVSSSAADMQRLPAPPAGERWRGRLPWAIALLASAIAAFSIGRVLQRGEPVETLGVRFAIPPPGRGAFQWIAGNSSAISPDGQQIALVVTTEGRRQIFIRAIGSPVLQPVAGAEGAFPGAIAPFWSPDSRSVGFAASGKLMRVPAAGGSPQTICDAPRFSSGTWAPDGTVLFGDGSRIYRVPASGGDPVPVSTIPGHEVVGWPSFLPGGRDFLYTAWPPGQKPELRVASLDSPRVTRIMSTESRAVYAPPGYLLFVREGVLLAQSFDLRTFSLRGDPITIGDHLVPFRPTLHADFSASDSGVLTYLYGSSRTRLVWVARDGSVLGTVGTPADYNFPRLSPDGQRLAVNTVDTRTGESDTWLVDLARGTSSRFTSHPGVEWLPTWSPDGRQMAFAASRGGIPNLHVKGLAAADEGQALVPSGLDVHFPWDWIETPAGQFILYMDRGETTGLDIMLLPLHGDRKPVPWLQTKYDELEASVSPDRRWVAYVSTATGSREVYVRGFEEPSDTWQVSTAGGLTPRWRHDGTELFYLSLDGDMMSVPIRRTPAFEALKPVQLFRVTPARTDLGLYDVSADGQRFLINAADAAEPLSVMVHVNWAAGLRQP